MDERTRNGSISLETLVVTMNQTDRSLEKRMNIRTDVLIGNQCGRCGEEIFISNGRKVEYLNTAETGVGRNRNLVLDHATGDICILADDDMRFADEYPSIVLQAFRECPQADLLIFNLIEERPVRKINRTYSKVTWLNYAQYGAARIAFRRSAIVGSGIRFSLLFGGGARYGSGEDTIFLQECLRKGIRMYTAPYALAELHQGESSSWKAGHRKFFFDKGAAYACLHPFFFIAFDFLFLIRHMREYKSDVSPSDAFRLMLKGSRDYLKTYRSKI